MAITGLPGPKTTHTATHRPLFADPDSMLLSGKQVILDASLTRDYGNYAAAPDDSDVIRAGMPLIEESSGLYTPWILGALTVAYTGTTTGLTLTVGIGAAKAINKYLGSDGAGTIYLSGPPTTAGTVDPYQSVTVSAISETAGTLTISAEAADYVVGTLIHPQTGAADPYTYAPKCILGDAYGVKVTDRDDSDVDSPVAKAVIGGYLDCNYLIGWPAAAQTKFRVWYMAELHRRMPSLTFNDAV